MSCSQRNGQQHSAHGQRGNDHSTKGDEQMVSDTLKRIIDELHLCDYSNFLKEAKNYNCYTCKLSIKFSSLNVGQSASVIKCRH